MLESCKNPSLGLQHKDTINQGLAHALSTGYSLDYESTMADPISSRMLLEASIQIVKQRQNKQFKNFLKEEMNEKKLGGTNYANYPGLPLTYDSQTRSTTKKHHYNRMRGLYTGHRSPPKH